jgi:hypothetical protein
LRSIELAYATVLVVAASTSALRAQPVQNVPGVELTAQVGHMPLYGGDGSVGTISTWAASVRLGYRLPLGPQRIAIEAYVAHAPPDDDPYNRAPAFTFVGAVARFSLRADPRRGIDPFLGIGFGRMQVEVEEVECAPPNCFAEGGPNFRDARLPTWAFDVGALIPLSRRFALRGDVRLYAPLGESGEFGDSVNRRRELAIGLTIRL